MNRDSNSLIAILRFNEYLTAESDEVRERVHNNFFYTSRILELSGEWHIVNTDTELIVITGGKSLDEVGAQWSFRSQKPRDSELGTICTLERLANESDYKGAIFNYVASESTEYTVKAVNSNDSFGGAHFTDYKLTYTSGGGYYADYSTTIYYKVLEPTQWNSGNSRGLNGGQLKLWCYSDVKQYAYKAEPFDDGRKVRIYYGDYQKEYNQ